MDAEVKPGTAREYEATSGSRAAYAGGASGPDPAARSSASPPSSGSGWTGASPGEAFRDGLSRLGEIKTYALHFLGAKLDGIKISLVNLGIYAALGIVGLIAGAGIIVTASVLLLVGIAHGLGALFGDRYWLGDLITGILVLGLTAAGIVIGMKKLTGASRNKLVQKYERRLHEQRVNYGHDVEERAAGANGHS